MNEGVTKPLILRKKSRSSRFASWTGDGNRFGDKMLRVLYLFLLVAIDFVMFVYSINGKLFENGIFNEAVLMVLGAVLALFFVIIILLSFSKDAQNFVCAFFTMVMVAIFFNQFALFNVDNFLETWLDKKASWLTFICIIPSSWLIGLILGAIVFFAFRRTYPMLFITLVLLFSGAIGVRNNEFVEQSSEQYSEVKGFGGNVGINHEGLITYVMVPKFPSYQFLNSIRDRNFRELRDLMVGFYAVNDFEIYPNAFVKNNDTMSNMVDIFNQVDYTSVTSAKRGYSELDNEWQFIKGSLDKYVLDENLLYDYLWKEGYGVSTYAMPGFNMCLKNGDLNTDRCVVKSYKTVPLYDSNKSVEVNIYALLSEWLYSLKNSDLKSVAKMLANKSQLKGLKVTSENRRVSIEGAAYLFETAGKHFKQDKGGQFYAVYVDLPSDIYVYDEFCNIKPRNQWVALKDNSLVSGGIDDKRQGYADQAKCLVGLLQMYMDDIYESKKSPKTDVIIQGVSTIRELAGMTAGRYSNFVKDNLVSLAIRKGRKPKFLINANICLASDFTKTLIRYQDYCYSIDNMNMQNDERMSLKKNLISNSIIRGSKISNIAANYKDWYEMFKKKSSVYQSRIQKKKNAEASREVLLENAGHITQTENSKGVAKVHNANIFVPSDDLILELDESGEIKSSTGEEIDDTFYSKNIDEENKVDAISQDAVEQDDNVIFEGDGVEGKVAEAVVEQKVVADDAVVIEDANSDKEGDAIEAVASTGLAAILQKQKNSDKSKSEPLAVDTIGDSVKDEKNNSAKTEVLP